MFSLTEVCHFKCFFWVCIKFGDTPKGSIFNFPYDETMDESKPTGLRIHESTNPISLAVGPKQAAVATLSILGCCWWGNSGTSTGKYRT